MTDEERRVPGNQEVIDKIESSMCDHLEEYHAFTAEQLRPMVADHLEMKETLGTLVSDVHGEIHPTAADPEHREGGIQATLDTHGEQLTELQEGQELVRRELGNGIKTKLSVGSQIIVAAIAAVAVIASALIGG